MYLIITAPLFVASPLDHLSMLSSQEPKAGQPDLEIQIKGCLQTLQQLERTIRANTAEYADGLSVDDLDDALDM